MATVDDRVVQLKFDNNQFKNASTETMTMLEKLKQSLDFSASRKGVEDLDGAFNKFNLGNLPVSIEGASAKFLALATIGITALSNIATKAIQVGAQLVSSLTIDPIKQGFQEYETQLNAVQTILANTQAAGTNLRDVNGALNELNRYADMTIYNFSEMTRNIGTFTAAGVALGPATQAIKGIANLAALSGSNSQQASTAMYQLSQAISAGRVSLMDWNSVVNAGMGGTVFQRALAQTAQKMGTLKDGAVKLVGPMKNVTVAGMSFRESISDPKVGGWLTSDVLTKTLAQFTGDMTDAQLAAEGFSAAEIKAIQLQAKTALNAATQVKTFSQLLDTTKEAIGSGWTQTWQYIFGDFGEAKKSWTEASNAINGFVNNFSNARNQILSDWHDLGGRTVAIDAIKNAVAALGSVLTPIKNAWREVFPATTGKDLYAITVAIRDFFESLKMGPETAGKLQQTFAGLFAILSIGKQILAGVFSVFKTVFSSVGESSGGILSITAAIGNFLVRLDVMLQQGGQIRTFFDNIASAIKIPLEGIEKLAGWLGQAFEGKDAAINATGDAIGRVADRLSPFGSLLSTLNAAWERFLSVLNTLSPFFASMLQQFSDAFAQIPTIIQQSVESGDYSAMLDTINTAIFGGIALMIRKFIKGGGPELGGGLLSSITGSFNELTNTLKSMQEQIKSKTLMNIAIAVGILTASVVALSLIPSAKLAQALAGLAGVFTELMLAMKVLDKISASSGFLKLPLISASLILLSTALLILSAAMLVMASMSWEELAKGLTTVALILGVLDVTTKPLAANAPGMMAAATAILILSGAMTILAGAMKIFATMSWEELGKGLVAVAGALAVIAVTMSLMPGPSMVVTAAGVLGVAVAMSVLAGAMSIFAKMSWEQIGKGLVGVGGALVIIAGAMALMPGPMMVLTAAGLVLVAIALNGIAASMKIMASMSWEEIAKGLVGMAGALLILAGGLYLMTGTLMGSAALVVAAGALMILAPAMKILGSMSWEGIAKGLVALAGAFAVIGLAGLLLTPVIPQIIGLAAAIALLGVGMALIGVGVLAFATAITMLVAVGSMGVVALTAILQTVIGVIPTVMKALELAIVAFANAITAAAPAVITAIVTLLGGLLDAIIKLTPKVAKTLGVLIDAMIALAVSYVPKLVIAGYTIVTGILDGIAKKLPGMMDAAGDVIVAFIKGLGKQALKITTAAGETLITFMEGLTTWINKNQNRMNNAGRDLVEAIIKGMMNGIASLGQGVINAISNVAGNALDAAKRILGINSPSKEFAKVGAGTMEGFALGIDKNADIVDLSTRRAGKMAIESMKKSLGDISEVLSSDMDVQPTVAPVLDLTEFRKDAASIKDILTPESVQPSVSAQNAFATNSAVESTKAALEALTALQQTGTTIEFTQTNNSPKALSSAEIYRQTKNQLSIMKGALDK